MIRKIIPLVLALVGLGIGAGAGIFLRPAHESGAEHPAEAVADIPVADYVKLNNQFVVPVVDNGNVVAMVILSLNLEVIPGSSEAIYAREPKLRDALLQVMFDHANAGGFNGIFTDGSNLALLRLALRESAQTVIGPMVLDVLISDIVRQDG